MQLELELQASKGPRLLIAASPEAAWQGEIASWLKRVAASAWQAARPAIVVTPTRGHAQALKARLLEAGLSALGLEFITPPYLRVRLAGNAETVAARREHLRFLLALAAEERLTDSSLPEAERLAAISVRRTPDHLLRLLEQLSAVGADFRQVDLPAFQPVVREFRALLRASRFELFPETDRSVLASAPDMNPAISHLLITGFHGAHWPLWHLLQAAAQSAESATVILQYPREAAADLDSAWIGSWEEVSGEATPITADTEPAPATRETLFLAGIDTREQAEAIVAAAHQFLAHKHCTRLGIVVPAAGALSRLVAASLHRQRVPHYDAMGQIVPGVFEASDFAGWMELQRTPRLNALLRFLNTLPGDHAFFTEISRAQIAGALNKALGEIALDDLTLLIAFARGREAKGELLSVALASIHFLPERAPFAEFLRVTYEAFAALNWDERWREIDEHAAWTENLSAPCSRTLFLQWLAEIAVSFRVSRDQIGQHPYARVQIVTAAQAEEQTWSHLILAGLNEGVWPAGARGDFLPAAQIDQLNRKVKKINEAATRRGAQGEGHVTVREGATLFLGAEQQRQLALAQFAGLVESASHGLALTASLVQEAAPERLSNPSEFFGRLYHEVHGQSVSQPAMRALHEQTRAWLGDANLNPPRRYEQTPSVLQTRVAYDARCDENSVSGEYDFALREPPDAIMPLSVSDAETMLASPALIWMERYLGVEGEEDATYVWNATVGKWTHAWLAAIFGRTENFVALPAADEIAQQILAAAERKRAEIDVLCRQFGRVVPDWWDSGWASALCLAQTLGRLLGRIQDWKWAVPEWRLEAQPIPVGDKRSLLLRGRADLLLAKTKPPPDSLQVPELWIIDFKTGNRKSVAPKSRKKDEPRPPRVLKQVLKREALQLALYALAARHLGAQRVDLSILSPVIAEPEAQLHDEDFVDCGDAFRELARMQATGIFGMRGSLRGAFSFAKNYPLATLEVDYDLVEERWEKTHPGLVEPEDAP